MVRVPLLQTEVPLCTQPPIAMPPQTSLDPDGSLHLPPPLSQSTSSEEDWRMELLQAVHKVIEHQHSMLATIAATKELSQSHQYGQMLQEQVGILFCAMPIHSSGNLHG